MFDKSIVILGIYMHIEKINIFRLNYFCNKFGIVRYLLFSPNAKCLRLASITVSTYITDKTNIFRSGTNKLIDNNKLQYCR